MQLTSTAFQNIETIPMRYTGDGEDVSPPMLWSDIPTDCVSLALLCEDPDAPQIKHQDHPFVHWVLYNVDPQVGMLPEGIPHDWKIEEPVHCEQGLNSMGRPGYNGPLPPLDHGMHRYFFRLFALSRNLKLPPRPMKEQLVHGMEGLILATAELIGTYERSSEEKKTGSSAA